MSPLATGGRRGTPGGARAGQRLQVIRRVGHHFDAVDVGGVAFVDLVGRDGGA